MTEFIESTPSKNLLNIKFNDLKQRCCYDNIDSNSIILTLSIKEKWIVDNSFDPFIKGITLQLFGNFLNRYSETKPIIENPRTQAENDRLKKVRNYLLDNLHGQFPSINSLSKMAGMSQTKFKTLFKKQFRTTSLKNLLKKKMSLANKMLISGNYISLTEILNELNYNKSTNFSFNFFEVFNKKPPDDFVKKKLKVTY